MPSPAVAHTRTPDLDSDRSITAAPPLPREDGLGTHLGSQCPRGALPGSCSQLKLVPHPQTPCSSGIPF